jgi:hypothetical protein
MNLHGSPHPYSTYGAARPAELPNSTALGCRSLIRMRPLVQVQPGPQRPALTWANAGRIASARQPNRMHPGGDEVLRAIPDSVGRSHLSSVFTAPLSWRCPRWSAAQRCQNPSCAWTNSPVAPSRATARVDGQPGPIRAKKMSVGPYQTVTPTHIMKIRLLGRADRQSLDKPAAGPLECRP